MKNYYIYIMTNYTNSVIYTGVTNNLERWMYEHKYEQGSSFAKRYHATKLVYSQSFSRIEDAIAAENRIKGWTREKKNKLILSVNPDWRDLGAIELEDSSLITQNDSRGGI